MFGDRLLQLIRLSLHSLRVHTLRSILTVLGIVLGVASVIVMLAIGEAARFEAIQQIQMLGATNIIVRSVKPPSQRPLPGFACSENCRAPRSAACASRR